MTRTSLCRTMSALAALALGSGLASSPAGAQTDVLVVGGSSVGVLANTQTLKTCISEDHNAKIHFADSLVTSIQLSGSQENPVVLQKELRVTVGEFRCVDIAYAELVATGFEPDPTTGAVTFRVDIRRPRGTTETVGPNRKPVAAIMIIDAATGKIEAAPPLWPNVMVQVLDRDGTR